ncbi:MAG: glycosyltransferase family 39 protein [Acidimicrobiia bacterium]
MVDTRGSVRSWWPVVALGLGAVVVSLLARHLLYPAFSWNRDESVYLWQVSGLQHGHFTSTTGGFPGSFHPWLAGIRGQSFFSQYTLGWPLILLAAKVGFGSPDAALAFGAALTVVGTYLLAREITQDPRVAWISATVMLVSPIVVIQSGIFLGYLFTLGLGLLFTTATISGFRTGRKGRLVGAGLLVGWIFMTRPFDAVLWGAAVVGVLAWRHRRQPKVLLTSAVAIGLGVLPLLVATLAYNKHVTGAFGQFPITAADPLDTFGFGHRRIMPTFHPANYTPGQALRSTTKQAVFLPIFLAGSYVLAALGVWGLWRRRREVGAQILVAITVAFPVGYFFFWGMFVSSPTMVLSGPIYFIPLYAVLAIAGVTEVSRWWQERRRVTVWLLAAMVVLTVPIGINRIDVNRRISEAQLPWERSSASVPDNSLVFVWQSGDYLMFLNPYSVNRPSITGPVIWAADQGAANLNLMAAYPHRTPFLQQTSIAPVGQVPDDHPKTPRVRLRPIRLVRGTSMGIHTTASGAGTGRTFYAYDTSGAEISPTASTGRSTDYRIQVGASTPGATGVGTLGTGTITIGLGRGSTAAAARDHPVFRQAIRYRVANGEMTLMTPIDSFQRVRLGPHLRWVGVPAGVASPLSLATRLSP